MRQVNRAQGKGSVKTRRKKCVAINSKLYVHIKGSGLRTYKGACSCHFDELAKI